MLDPSRQITARVTGAPPHAVWARSRHEALWRAMVEHGADSERAWSAAIDIMAHVTRETGWGGAEWNFALGNIKAYSSWPGLWQTLPDHLDYRAYGSLDEGAVDYVQLASSGPYRAPTLRLLAGGDGEQWYSDLMTAGWHPWSTGALVEFRSIRHTLAGMIPAHPPARNVVPWLLGAGALALGLWAVFGDE